MDNLIIHSGAEKMYKVLFDVGGIPMWMSLETMKEVNDFKKSFKVLEIKEE